MKYLALLLIPFYWALQNGTQFNPVPKLKHKFIIVAHRGDHTHYPENTIEAYNQAIKDKADYIEIDLRTTADGKLVSLHDASVNRMTDGKGLVKDLTLDQIENLKVSVKNKPDTTAIYHIPTFEQILKLCRNKIHIYIDFKEADATQTLNMLKQFHMEKQVLVYINKPSQITDWRKTDATMPLMVSLPDSVKSTESMRLFINQNRPDLLDGNYAEYDAQMVALANALGLPVWPDAQGPQEGPSVWDKAIEKGLRGLQTDNPPALAKYLKEKGLR
ncbi:glycerophosphoryl diester phosphodiesterase [Mucilaginibacter frigoritolerans]|uniref:Glycerophosphoryl diester phosphodiesterase n=1 Tax=Mucilaginibacter frigoritolerans TaxID=652788 RepID=A0A562U6Z3_9SPHI|nr:glycerophosphodiester phosphodiesterase family protein [Mucilaginibacter frigoritolerans]TWJ01582.1 glycerophosphoryl diester phosphodiesterase [Mucilaginibacter frigoritolerans]